MKSFKIMSGRTLILILCLVLFFSCKNGADRKNTLEMIRLRTLGLAYLEEDKLPDAENTFRRLTEIAPREALGYANLGLVYIRMSKYKEAEENLRRALELAPHDPEIQLNLAEVMLMTNREKQAVILLESTLSDHPDHIRTLYKLGQLYAVSTDENLRLRGEQFLIRVVDYLPANIAARFELIDLLLRQQKADLATGYFEEIRKQMPEFPDEANAFYEQCLIQMKEGKVKEALISFNIFRNILKPTALYRLGYDELKGAGGPLIGTPIITFRQDVEISGATPSNVLDAIRFTDATENAGLNVLPVLNDRQVDDRKSAYILSIDDFDGNGTQDIYASGFDGKQGKNVRFLLQNNSGKYVNIIAEAGIDHRGADKFAVFADYDNDGYLDLYIVNQIKNILYYHFQPRKFRDVTETAGIAGHGSGSAASIADFDHDGDLDIYQLNQHLNSFYRNNLDGTFTENAAKMKIAGANMPSLQAVYADFDDDGDLDIFVLNDSSSNTLYSNLRQGQFADVTEERGLTVPEGSRALSMGDYNNDGLADLLIIAKNGDSYYLYANRNGTQFVPDQRSEEMTALLKNYISQDASFMDFDNDGHLDLLVSVRPIANGTASRGLLLFHNDGTGVFHDVSRLLPENFQPCGKIYLADYNEDGDLDIFLSADDGRIHLLRNDGGNTNNYLDVKLVGLRTGSGKNNYFGIGAKLEVKAGALYQSKTVTKTISHFGLGGRNKADVVRVLWTNGVPQNLFEPGSNQSLLEKQILKGSCPFLYTWNGTTFEFATDVLWRSALGMPLGIMGGETAYAFSDPSEDYFKIPGKMLVKKDGNYTIQLTSELWETAYFDQVKLLIIDHPDSSDIFIDERFTPPPYPPFHVYHVSAKKYPRSIVDERGNDLRRITRYKDNDYVSDFRLERYQGITKVHDLVIDLGETDLQAPVRLFLNGWVFPTDASINMALSQSSQQLVVPPYLQVKNKNDQWQTVIANLSFPMGKDKYVILDLSDKFLSHKRQVRLRTGMQIYWDYIFFTAGEEDLPMQLTTLIPETADLHYRGFSRMYRKGGRYGPFWFDYNDVSQDPFWRDLEGFYTRYGDVKPLLLEADSKYIVTNAGDEITIQFNATEIPDTPSGWSRDFIIYTNGWLKDGDLNTAFGQTVEPLPFRGMSAYPYSGNESYPKDEDHRQYLRVYNTRKITTEKFRKSVIRSISVEKEQSR